MAAELDPILLDDYLPNASVPDWNTNPLTTDWFDPGFLTFHSTAFLQDALGLAQPFPPPTSQGFPIFFGGMLPDASPIREVERITFLPFPSTPGVSVIPQATVPVNVVARARDPRHEIAAGVGKLIAGDVHLPAVGPTMVLPPPPFPPVVTLPPSWIKIPQRSYNYGCKQFDFKRLEPITFSTKDHPGIKLRDALRKNYTRLNGKNDQILQATSAVSSCRLRFPGYPDNGSSCQIHMLNWTKARTPIMRGKLAHEVAKKVDRYLTRMARIDPDGSVEDFWRIGQGFMHIDNMYLVSLKSVSKGSFQPEIYVEVPPAPRVNVVPVLPHVADAGRK